MGRSAIALRAPEARDGARAAPDTPDTRVPARWLLPLRAAWIALALVTLALVAAGVPATFAAIHLPCSDGRCLYAQLSASGLRALGRLGIPVGLYAVFVAAIDIVCIAIYGGLAGLIFWRRSDDRMGLYVSMMLLLFGATVTGVMDSLPPQHASLRLPVAILEFLGTALFTLFLFIFPDGRFVPGWMRWLSLVWVFTLFARFLMPGSAFDVDLEWPVWLLISKWLIILASVVFAQAYRYRRASDATQRQQTKWVALGIGVGAAGALGLFALWYGVLLRASNVTPQTLAFVLGAGVVCAVGVLLIPVSITIAILRYRLYDIDVLINRALVYGTLTAILGAVYFATVIAAQALAQALTGEAGLPPVATVASTLLIAALFNPVRHRLQTLIDRRFYRSRYDSATTLATFGATLRTETDLDALCGRLTAAVEEAMRPEHVSLWLRRPAEPSPPAPRPLRRARGD